MFYSLTRILRQIRKRKELGVSVLVTVILICIIGNALVFYFFDHSIRAAQGKPITIWDGIWYSVVSITTIGYGDISSQTLWSRIGTVFFIIIIGLATFTTAVGMAVDWIADLRHKERTGMGKPSLRNHLIIVNFPNESRIRQIIREYQQDSRHKRDEIVIVSDNINELPFHIDNVYFIRGWPLDEETFQRAAIAHARQAIILSPSQEDPRSDSMVASISFIMNNINPKMDIVAECLEIKHRSLFNVSEHIKLVYTLQISNNLLVQEAQDPGVTQLTQAITSNEIEGTLATTKIETVSNPDLSYTEYAKNLLDHGINLVGIIRDQNIIVCFDDLCPTKNDQLIYVSSSRRDWQDLDELLT